MSGRLPCGLTIRYGKIPHFPMSLQWVVVTLRRGGETNVRTKRTFEAEGFYDGHPYMAVAGGRIDVDLNGRIVRFNSIERSCSDI